MLGLKFVHVNKKRPHGYSPSNDYIWSTEAWTQWLPLCRHFSMHLKKKKTWYFIAISPNFVCKCPIDNKSPLAQVMAWSWVGDIVMCWTLADIEPCMVINLIVLTRVCYIYRNNGIYRTNARDQCFHHRMSHEICTNCQTSNISHTKSWNLNVSHLVLQFSFPYALKPGAKSRMKM